MSIFTDLQGDDLEITATLDREDGHRSVWIDTYEFTPDQARQIAAELTATAAALDAPLLALLNKGHEQ
jgi:hypothetical protein